MTEKRPWTAYPPPERYPRTWRVITVVAAMILWPFAVVIGLATWVWLRVGGESDV